MIRNEKELEDLITASNQNKMKTSKTIKKIMQPTNF